MRVVAGTARGRPLKAPAGSTTRPTSDRVRESVFNILTSMDVIEGAAVVDLFAGTGALAIEAVSRGAASAVAVDAQRDAVEAIRSNVDVLDDPSDVQVVHSDVVRWVRQLPAGASFDVVFADPPYGWDGWGELLGLLAGRTTLMVAETSADFDPGPRWETARSRRYGTTLVSVARPAPAPALGQAEDLDLRFVSSASARPNRGGDT